MKIFYAVQATGNGHISRAMELLPYLQQYGSVDVFLSGANSTLPSTLPVTYRSKGLSLFYSNSGGLSYKKILQSFAPLRLIKEIKELPVDKYDLVINDFECITALACAIKKVPSINFGHQASFISDKVPRPDKKDLVGEWILKNYARASQYLGLHFEPYDDFILPPVIKKEIWQAQPQQQDYITVYLSSYADNQLLPYLQQQKNTRFQLFSKEVKGPVTKDNITLLPVSKEGFNKSLIHCSGIITGAGFETPAEALYLQKKLMAIPIKGQYEQYCNGAALEQLGVKQIMNLDAQFNTHFEQWMNSSVQPRIQCNYSAADIIGYLMHTATRKKMALDFLYPDFVFN